jgi:hypothetical protein
MSNQSGFTEGFLENRTEEFVSVHTRFDPRSKEALVLLGLGVGEGLDPNRPEDVAIAREVLEIVGFDVPGSQPPARRRADRPARP